MLNQIDLAWKTHLEKIDILRDSIGWRSYGQLDPLTEYKKEAYNLFDEREAAYNIQKDALSPDYWDLHEDEYIIQYLNQKNQVLEAIHTGEHGMLGIWAARVDQISKLTNPKLMGVWTNQADIPVNGMATRQKFLNMDLEHYFFRD